MTTTRPSFTQIYMGLARSMSERSTCRRLNVGCVITTTDYRKVLAVGYNGNVSGGANDCDTHGEAAVGNCGCLHAEENAVINCDSPRGTPKLVFCTHLPCKMCAKRLVNLGGVHKVFYEAQYRLSESPAVFQAASIHVQQYAQVVSVAVGNAATANALRDLPSRIARLCRGRSELEHPDTADFVLGQLRMVVEALLTETEK